MNLEARIILKKSRQNLRQNIPNYTPVKPEKTILLPVVKT